MFDRVRKGRKKQTIRPVDAYKQLKVGDKVHCYSTKKVKGVRRPVLDELLYVGVCSEILKVAWKTIKDDKAVARMDGFKDSDEMKRWFAKKYRDLTDDKLFKVIRW